MKPRRPVLVVLAAVSLSVPGLARAQGEQAAQACPSCQCECSCPSPTVEVPLPPEQDPERLVTGSTNVTVGAGGSPSTVVAGPLVLTSVIASCPMVLALRSGGTARPVGLPTGRLYVPEGATLEVDPASAGLCSGTVVYSGFRP